MRRWPRRQNRGFTLVEIMVVVMIISLLAAIAVPSFQRIQRQARITAISNDFRVFAAAFSAYSHATGGWPPDVAAGAIPAGMTGYLGPTSWLRVTPMGGKYNWEYNQTHFGQRVQAAVGIGTAVGATLVLDVNMLLALESEIDGANYDLLGGSFRLGTGLVPLFVIEP